MKVISGLYGITSCFLQPSTEILLSTVKLALAGGMRVLQYRNKQDIWSKRLHEAWQLKTLCAEYKALFVINDDVQLANRIKADGIHLGQNDACATQARALLGPECIIGVTCHGSLPLAYQAINDTANYLAFGCLFASKTKPQNPSISLSILRQAKNIFDVPIIGIGGITLSNVPAVINAGVDAIAVIDGLFSEKCIKKSASKFACLF